MKKSLILLAALGLLATTNAAARSTVSGTFTDLRCDTIIVSSAPFGSNAYESDTLMAKDGSFSVSFDNKELLSVHIVGMPVQTSANKGTNTYGFGMLLLPDNNVKVEGTLRSNKKAGGLYDEIDQVNVLTAPYQQKIDSLRNVCMEMKKEGKPNEEINAKFAPASGWAAQIYEIRRNYIKEHPSSNVSVYLLSQLPTSEIGGAIEALSPEAKTGIMAPYFNAVKESYEKELARQEAQKNVQPGKPAPNFTLKDIDGKDFTLSSLKGKYVVLDFWGSWCIWCIRGIPEMKKTYEKYRDRIEFVGIDCRDSEEDWKEAVKEHELPWIHVINSTDPDVVTLYGVSGFPTKVVIDPDGKIAKVVVGEDPEFYTYIDSLMAK